MCDVQHVWTWNALPKYGIRTRLTYDALSIRAPQAAVIGVIVVSLFSTAYCARSATWCSSLGLAIVRNAIERHGGQIDVERSPLGGARLRMTIPRASLAESPELVNA